MDSQQPLNQPEGHPAGPRKAAQGFIVDIAKIRGSMLSEVGGKAANLGELVSAGLPVPPGFASPPTRTGGHSLLLAWIQSFANSLRRGPRILAR
jgi:hypothetical protein